MQCTNSVLNPCSSRWLKSILIGGLLGAAVAPTSAATYEPADFILIECGDIDSEDERVIMFGINNLGQVVGLRLDDAGDPFEAVIWLPFGGYGVGAGLEEIDEIFTFNPGATAADDGTIAFDINDEGVAVGRSHVGTDKDAIIWDLSGPGLRTILSDRFNAFSINNDDDAILVGGDGAYYEYVFSSFPSPTYKESFIHEIGGSTTDLPLPSPLTGVAFGVSDTIIAQGDVLISGLKSCDQNPIICFGGGCDDGTDGAFWPDPSANGIDLEPDVDGQVEPTEFIVGHAVSDDGIDDALVAGFGHDPVDSITCRQFGYVWRNGPGDSPDRLPLLVSQSSHSEMALDIRDTLGDGTIEVVGRNTTASKALLWRYDDGSSSWSTIDISGDTADVIDDLRDFNQLICATAINDDGWIVVWGEQGASPIEYRSGVLIPYDEYRTNVCPGDIASPTTLHPDGVVDVFDLLALLDNWNTDKEGRDIASPTNIVDVFDLLDLLADWGCQIGAIPSEVLSLEDEVTGAGLTMDDWDDYQDVMTDSQESGKVKTNWNCWMKNYLSGCTTCPPCPDTDPFD